MSPVDPEVTHVLKWKKDVATHDYAAAQAYLSLRFDRPQAELLVKALREKSKLEVWRSNDILRSCRLPALPFDDPGVRRDMLKLVNGEKLSPVLLVSFTDGTEIADGYHRVSLAYNLDPFASVPVRLTVFRKVHGG